MMMYACAVYIASLIILYLYRYVHLFYCLSIVYDKIGVNNVNFYSGLYNVDSGGDKVWSAVFVVAAECYEALGRGEVQHPLLLHISPHTSSAI